MRKMLVYAIGIFVGIIGSAVSQHFNSSFLQTLLLISAGSVVIIAPLMIVVTLPKVKNVD